MTKKERNDEIVRLYGLGAKKSELSRMFGISCTAITQIIAREDRRVKSGAFSVLTNRERNLLLRKGIKTIDELKLFLSKNRLSSLRQIGEKTEEEIKIKLNL